MACPVLAPLDQMARALIDAQLIPDGWQVLGIDFSAHLNETVKLRVTCYAPEEIGLEMIKVIRNFKWELQDV